MDELKKVAKKIVEHNINEMPLSDIIDKCCNTIMQKELSKITGISVNTLMNIKYSTGKTSKKTLLKLCDGLDLSKKTREIILDFNENNKKNHAGKMVYDFDPKTYQDYALNVELGKRYKISIYGKDHDKRTVIQTKTGVVFWIDIYKVGVVTEYGYKEFFGNSNTSILLNEI